MTSKIFAERTYVWISNMCLFGVVAIAIAYDRVPMSEVSKMALFWGAMGLGVISFAAYALRRNRMARETRVTQAQSAETACASNATSERRTAASELEKVAPRIDEAESVKERKVISRNPVHFTRLAHKALFSAELELLEEMERTYLAKQRSRYSVVLRTLEQSEPLKLQELLEQVYLRNAGLEVLAASAETGKARKNPSKFAKQLSVPHRTMDIVDELFA